MIAASRAVTEAARERRMQLVGSYVDQLEALGEQMPTDDSFRASIRSVEGRDSSAFGWEFGSGARS